ncbi:MAG: hypothetical protein ACYDEX_17250 [Mobilitalea sp.]
MYDIYIIESEGNQLEEYYQSKLDYGYWDFEYEGITLTKKELTENEEAIDALFETSSEETFDDIYRPI